MEEADIEIEAGFTKEIVRVATGSKRAALTKIGHEQKSETFFPEIKADELFVYCDCPGFVDNRAAVINIANAVNMGSPRAGSDMRLAMELNKPRLPIPCTQHLITPPKLSLLRDPTV